MNSVISNLTVKIDDYLHNRVTENELYEWGRDAIIQNEDEERVDQDFVELVKDIFLDLIELNESEWSSWSMGKAKYYHDCLTGKEKYSSEKAKSLGRNVEKNQRDL